MLRYRRPPREFPSCYSTSLVLVINALVLVVLLTQSLSGAFCCIPLFPSCLLHKKAAEQRHAMQPIGEQSKAALENDTWVGRSSVALSGIVGVRLWSGVRARA